MSDKTGIEWTDATWNPVTGCTKLSPASPGCANCYASMFAERFRGTPGHYFEQGFDVQLRPEKLDQPMRWKRPRRIFVNSMSDLFHDSVPDAYIGLVFSIMAQTPRHTFQVLTKRHARMRSLLTSWARDGQMTDLGYMDADRGHRPMGGTRQISPLWTPPPNVWLGVSTENQQWADIRIPALLDTPAAIRFISAEPLLGPIDLNGYLPCPDPAACGPGPCSSCATPDNGEYPNRDLWSTHALDWVIAGGESGRVARPMHPDWARGLRDQCQDAGVPFMFKQWGEWAVDFHRGTHLLQKTSQLITRESGTVTNPYGSQSGVQDLVDRGHQGWVRVRRAGKHTAGRMLDGRTWDEFPEVAR